MKEDRDTISLESDELVRVRHKGLVVAIWADASGHLEVETHSTMVIEAGHLGAFADEDSVEPNSSGTVRLLVH